MKWCCFSLLALVVCQLSTVIFADDAVSTRKFPDNFVFGVATCAYQVEGAWNLYGKGENIWDRDTHTNQHLYWGGANGDVAADHYHKYKEDIQLIKGMGLKAFRFSISWARIFPTGIPSDGINQEGINHYRDLIQETLNAGLEPLVTIYHWDIPQVLQDNGGWLNETVVDYYLEFARACFDNFGDLVSFWTTFNEPKQMCYGGYDVGTFAPSISNPGVGGYICSHNLLKAHAKAYRLFDSEYRSKKPGSKIGMVIDLPWFEPASNSEADQTAAETMRQFQYGWQAHPIFFGDYPQVMKDRIAYRSKLEGFSTSRLPSFTQEEINEIKGTADYLGVNLYTTYMVSAMNEPTIGTPNSDLDNGVRLWQKPEWESTVIDWFKVVPWGARKAVKWLSDTYGSQYEIWVTENGYTDERQVDDVDTRWRYHKTYLSSLNDAIHEDGVNVAGYMAWSIIDDFEWRSAYRTGMGFYHVDFESENKTRTPKASRDHYARLAETFCLVDQCTS